MATSASSSGLSLSGLASGIDWTSIVNELLVVERAPETQMNTEISTDQQKSSAYSAIGTQLTTLQNDINTLSDPSFFDTRNTSVSIPSVASATAAEGTPLGTYSFKATQLATQAVQVGTGSIGAPLSPTDNVATLQVGSAGFATPVTPGTFTVNGKIITIASTDTLQSVFDQINTATGGAVTASYSASTDEISLNSSSPIVLGSATDTSNFLQASELFNNGTGIITSASGLGGVNLNNPMSSANLAVPITGSGSFTINGVQISYDASTDSINDVLQRINDSTAGVTATYDSVNDRFELTNKNTGDVGISLQDNGTGNFLAATGLSGGTLQRGNNLQYTINNGGTLTSQSNTVSGTSAGLPGLSITATEQGVSTNITVGSDTSTIASTITSFVNDYNAVQNYISGQTKPSTDSSGNTTPGTLTGDMDSEGIADQLRSLTDAAAGSGAIQTLNDLGIMSNGSDNTLDASDTAQLTSALNNNLEGVKDLFTNSSDGIATQLSSYLNNVNGPNGALASDENNMSKEVTTLQASISTLETKVTADGTRLTNEFVAMETAINTINTQKQYLNDYFNSSSANSNAAPASQGSSFGNSNFGSSSSPTGSSGSVI